MSKEISIICAARHKANPGMESVDLAFYFLVRRCFPDAKLKFMQICDETGRPKKDGENGRDTARRKNYLPFEHGVLQGNLDELYKSDAIIFWGDFFHMAHYREDEARRLVKFGKVDSREEGLDVIDRHFFLTDAPAEVLKKVIIFGENLLFNQIGDYSAEPYCSNLKRLLSSVSNIWMRDVSSALTVCHLTKDYGKNHLGTDCATLLKKINIDELQMNNPHAAVSSANKIGVFLHRNSTSMTKQLRFIKKIAKATGLKAQWLPWRPSKRRNFAKFWAFPGLEIPKLNAEPSIGDLFGMMKNYAFVITDTYHICVNAWNMGIPAICIGESVSDSEMDVSCGASQAWRDKRWSFYSMCEALKYYVYIQELNDSGLAKRRVKQLTEAIGNKKDIEMISQFLRQQADNAERELVAAIGKLIASAE